MSPKNYDDLQKLLDDDYIKKHYAKCQKFMQLFHEGVVFQHIGSDIHWVVVSTFKHCGTGEVRCRIRSLYGKATKELSMDKFNHYRLIYAPPAVEVLFGDK